MISITLEVVCPAQNTSKLTFIKVKQLGDLNSVADRDVCPTELETREMFRIYALVRMGISESHKIATLLFLSPQTIFNHRTQVRNRALDRENFEKNVMHICEVNDTDAK